MTVAVELIQAVLVLMLVVVVKGIGGANSVLCSKARRRVYAESAANGVGARTPNARGAQGGGEHVKVVFAKLLLLRLFGKGQVLQAGMLAGMRMQRPTQGRGGVRATVGWL